MATDRMEPDEEPTTDQIVAAFRSKRAAASASPPASLDDEVLRPADATPLPADGGDPAALVDADPLPALTTDPAPLAPARPLASEPSALATTSASPAMPALRPAVQGGSVALTAAAPGLNLSTRLLEDRFVSRAGNRTGVGAGIALALLGLVTVVADQALRGQRTVITVADVDLTSIGVVLAAVGLVLAVLFLFLPRRRSLRVRLAATQQEEWARVKAEAEVLRRRSLGGAVAAFLGLAAAAASYVVLAPPQSGYAAAAFALVAIAGIAVLAWAASRRGVVQRLYVQTLVLSRLEQTGLGPSAEADPRVAPVLRSLDRLLGALPESAVRRFLASDEATQYLELIDDLSKDRGHGR